MDTEKIINSIGFNWNCLLLTRAVFSNKDFGVSMSYDSPGFYTQRIIDVSVNWRKLGKFKDVYNPKLLNYWHNANFIIRIYGVLDEYKLLEKNNRKKSKALQLIHILRNKVGAHQNGLQRPKKKYLRKVNELFKELRIREMEIDKISNFDLAIDSVLLKLKNALVEDIRTF
ncbi:MAG: hypothetical protein KDD36_13125 [Flavobacteriales bacterium]|nr:hypothetical protein [Flavobacteriales bacterium]